MPTEIRIFERLYLASMVVAVLASVTQYKTLVSLASPGFIVFAVLLGVGTSIALMLLVSRGRKRWAAWVMLGLSVLAVCSKGPMLSEWPILATKLFCIQYAIQLISFYFLFLKPAGRDWITPSSFQRA